MKKKKGLSVLAPYLYIAPIAMILLTFVAGSLILAIYFSLQNIISSHRRNLTDYLIIKDYFVTPNYIFALSIL